MSSISFATQDNEVLLRGAERAYMSMLVNNLGIGMLDLRDNAPRLVQLFPATHWIRHLAADQASALNTALRVADHDLHLAGKPINTWEMLLNTALTLGSDPIKLAARLHGQCELHTWVDGNNRAWLADIIRKGLADGIYRPDMGWEGLTAFLTNDDTLPVVTSYSVCDTFPYPDPDIQFDWASMTPEQQDAADAAADAWYSLPAETRWAEGLSWLQRSPRGLELTPDNWNDYRFGDGTNAIQLLQQLPSPTAETPR